MIEVANELTNLKGSTREQLFVMKHHTVTNLIEQEQPKMDDDGTDDTPTFRD